MTPTHQHKFHFTDHDWERVSARAALADMTPQQWLVNVVIGSWFRAAGEQWEGIKSVGNPQWVARDSGRCVCKAAQCAADGITCATCGKDLFSKGGE